MCTLIVAWQVFDDSPICVAANRDEATNRPASPPYQWDTSPKIVAPRDEKAGGTWIGYNEHGVFVAITNRWETDDATNGDRSRGLLVTDALAEPTAEAATNHVTTALTSRSYEAFHLVVADMDECYLVEHTGPTAPPDTSASSRQVDTVAAPSQGPQIPPDEPAGDTVVHSLTPGVHTIVNVGWDGAWFVPPARPDAGRRQADHAERVHAALQPHVDDAGRPTESGADWTDRAADILGDHDYGVCIHGNGFGTRSSSLIRLNTDHYFAFADGHPCETPYQPVHTTH